MRVDTIGRATCVGCESHLDPADLAQVITELQIYLRTETPHDIFTIMREESLCGYAGCRGLHFLSVSSGESMDSEIARQFRVIGYRLTLRRFRT